VLFVLVGIGDWCVFYWPPLFVRIGRRLAGWRWGRVVQVWSRN